MNRFDAAVRSTVSRPARAAAFALLAALALSSPVASAQDAEQPTDTQQSAVVELTVGGSAWTIDAVDLKRFSDAPATSGSVRPTDG